MLQTHVNFFITNPSHLSKQIASNIIKGALRCFRIFIYLFFISVYVRALTYWCQFLLMPNYFYELQLPAFSMFFSALPTVRCQCYSEANIPCGYVWKGIRILGSRFQVKNAHLGFDRTESWLCSWQIPSNSMILFSGYGSKSLRESERKRERVNEWVGSCLTM